MTDYFRVKNWDDFQHYKDRNPPWIKLHNQLLDNYDFECLPDASKAHLLCIWMLASRTNNKMPFDPNWIAKKIGALTKVDLQVLVNSNFLVLEDDASNPLQLIMQDDTESIALEEKRRVREEKDIKEELFNKAWEIYQKKGNRKTSIFRFMKLKQSDIDLLFIHLPKYVQSTPDKQFRKDFQAYINQEVWNDEIISFTKKDDNKNQGKPYQEWGTK